MNHIERFRRIESMGALSLLLLTGAFTSQHRVEVSHSEAIKSPDLNFWTIAYEAEQYKAMLKQIRAYIDKHPDFLPLPSQQVIDEWIAEVAPVYGLDGFVDTVQIPTDDQFKAFTDPQQYATVLGQSDCGRNLYINARTANPLSSWYKSIGMYGTIAHELGHEQQGTICQNKYNDMGMYIDQIEASAQIGMLQTEATLAIDRNRIALASYVYEMNDILDGTLWYMKVTQPGVYTDAYTQIYNALYDDADSRAVMDHAQHVWKNHPDDLETILYDYNYLPRLIMEEAAVNNSIATVLYPNTQVDITDALYLLKHAPAMVQETFR